MEGWHDEELWTHLLEMREWQGTSYSTFIRLLLKKNFTEILHGNHRLANIGVGKTKFHHLIPLLRYVNNAENFKHQMASVIQLPLVRMKGNVVSRMKKL